ncbi:MAG: AzlD domain-containing protein [Christensenellaceae bacterium]|nr:AzlD domain-containing protein [Christensenellaceae bacterium]
MNNTGYILAAIAVMALVTYLPRVIPLAVFRKKITSRFFRSFLTYMPYGVLAAMVFPAVFTSTGNVISSIVGAVVALGLSCKKLGLLPVALGSTAAVFIAEQIIALVG